jgi:Ca2+-binding RTX toxin-like protein
MATHNKTGQVPDTWQIDESNDTWNLGTLGVISVGYSLGEIHGINEAADKSGNVINIRGDVMADGPWGMAAVNIAGQKTHVHVFENAKLVSDTGINSTSPGAIILNEGTIEAGTGIEAHGARRVTNAGDITGLYGIISDGGSAIVNEGRIEATMTGIKAGADGTVIHNLKGATIEPSTYSIQLEGQGTSRIINDGDLLGGIDDGAGDLTLINRGHIKGGVSLGDGNDVFDTRKGTFDGTAYGNEGNDVFKISKTNTAIIEAVNEGNDKVISTVAYNLSEYVEDLRFTGARNIDGAGNDSGNLLIGNNGRNILYGNGGEDALSGGRGNDRLFGGDDADMFEFLKRTGTDTIADFEDGLDVISSAYAQSMGDVKDLLKNHAEQRGDDIVITYGDDRLIIRDMELNDLSKDDFRFL